MQIPILNGIYTDNTIEYRTSYPRNLIPIPSNNGLISQGYLRQANGIVKSADGPGTDRGAINWNGICYRVMGSSLVTINEDETYTVLGDVGGNGWVTMDYSFDRLAIASNGNLFYWDGTTLTQVTDTDLGTVVDFVWVDGYFMTTDGQYLIVTELNDPLSINPLKYGSAEADPDPILGLLKVRNEVYAMNRYTVEVFDNIGGDVFPFQRIEGAQIQKGVVGTKAACIISDTIAFMGSGRNEMISIYLGTNSVAQRIATDEIDQVLQSYTETELSNVTLETVMHKGNQYLMVHLPDECLVYAFNSSQQLQTPIWFSFTSSLDGKSQFKAKNIVWCYGKWLCADPTSAAYGYFSDQISTHYGENVGWEFNTTILYNEGRGAIINSLELVALTGRQAIVPYSDDVTISTQYSLDGRTWSTERPISIGRNGDAQKRLVWFSQGHMRNWRIQKFKGTSEAFISISRLEANIEPLGA